MQIYAPLYHTKHEVDLSFKNWISKIQRSEIPPSNVTKLITLISNDQPLCDLLKSIHQHSPFLSQLLEQDLDFIYALLTGKPDKIWKQVFNDQRSHTDYQNKSELMQDLRSLKKKSMLLIAHADLTGAWTLEKITRHLSDLADYCLTHAVRYLLWQLHEQQFINLTDLAKPELGSGFLIVGMGKLGAFELNYSSDIDLIVFYDLTNINSNCPEKLPKQFVRLTRDLVNIMDDFTKDGYLFRTDLRLRPDPGAMPLAVSYTAAEIYYGSLGQNWERAAMIKARPIIGDIELASNFMKMVSAWIWRKNLDFATIQDIHSIKRQINSTHLGSDNSNPVDLLGYNIKLGHGGIREIEFFAQTQQLIYGGRNINLRQCQTLSALKQLCTLGHISHDTCSELCQAYVFFRHIEHRLQMQNDQQTHSLPTTENSFLDFANFMGFTDAPALRKEVLTHITNVQKHYHHLFEESPSLSAKGNLVFTGTEAEPETLTTLHSMGFNQAEKIFTLIKAWHHGRYRATRSDRARQLLTALVPQILKDFSQTPHPDTAFIRFDDFLQSLPSGVPIFSMFQHNLNILELLAKIMGTSPKMASHIAQHPELIETLTSRQNISSLPDTCALQESLDQQIKTATHYEDTLNILRRWARDQRFLTGLHILQSKSPIDKCHRCLSDIAQIALKALLPAVISDFQVKHGRFETGQFSLIFYGKLGSQQMTFTSDLDLVAIYDVKKPETLSDGQKPLSPSQYYLRLTQRLITAINAPTTEGKLYEVDMRLRPSGNAGPLASSYQAFEHYQKTESWTWETMSLLRARCVIGSDNLCQRLTQMIQQILQKKNDNQVLRHDIIDMRQRLETEFGQNDLWDMKHRNGGMLDILFSVQYLALSNAHKIPAILIPDTLECLKSLEKHNIIPTQMAHDLSLAYEIQKQIQSFLRLSMELPFIPDQVAENLKQSLAKAIKDPHTNLAFNSFIELEKMLNNLCGKASAHYKGIFQIKDIENSS